MSAIADWPVGITGARPEREADVRKRCLLSSAHDYRTRPGFSPSYFFRARSGRGEQGCNAVVHHGRQDCRGRHGHDPGRDNAHHH